MEQIEYTRTVVPSSMRSSYWKYFGFPSDNGNNILTRQKIVCTLCNTAIAYNRNTSNLRTHLMAKHPEAFQKLLTNKRSASDQERQETDFKNIVQLKRCETVEQAVVIDQSSVAPHSEGHYEKFDEISKAETFEDSLNRNQSMNNLDIIQQGVSVQYQHQQQSLENMLADMAQNDILSLSLIKGSGFRMFNQQVSGLTVDDATYQRVTAILNQRIADAQVQISNTVHNLSQNSPYSLSIEWYDNSDDLTILNIYFSFLNDNQSQLNSILYHTTIAQNEVNLFEILKEVNIGNCKSIVVNNLENIKDGIVDFARCNDMDLIECLPSTLERCLQKIFQLPFVMKSFTELCAKIQQTTNLLALNPPYLRMQCSWSKLNYLSFVYEHIVDIKWDDSFLELKAIYEYIKPLKMALDIISDEPLPLCTLSRPLVIKLFEQHFAELQTNQILIQIQMILENELKTSIKRSTFLREATYFDPRFRHEFVLPDAPFDLNILKAKVIERFTNILDVHYIARCGDKARIAAGEQLANAKKTNLQTFFNYSDSRVRNNSSTSLVAKTNLDVEFEHYHIDTALDLNESPVKWWLDQAQTYRELNKIVFYYLTTPCCCVHRLYNVDEEQRWQKLNRRKQLNHFCQIERHLWYLHYNEQK